MGLLAGCSTISAMNPVNWWHKQEGGKIAQERPAPPGADQPYPNLATVPAKPEPPDAEAMKNMTDSLIADRANAQHLAQSAPLADPSSPTASPSLFGVGTAPPPPPAGAATQAGTASASIPAVTAPPPPAQPPAPAPRKAVQSTPLAAPAVPAAETQPALPAEPPARPAIAGAAPPPVAAPTPMPAAAAAGPSAAIVFVEGSPALSAPAADEVKAFAAKRGTGVIVVTGYGDTPASDPTAQSTALTLGLSRARAVSDALKADGVPPEAVRVNAEASGRGVSLHLLQ